MWSSLSKREETGALDAACPSGSKAGTNTASEAFVVGDLFGWLQEDFNSMLCP
jgi:hypothetical protein